MTKHIAKLAALLREPEAVCDDVVTFKEKIDEIQAIVSQHAQEVTRREEEFDLFLGIVENPAQDANNALTHE